MHAFMFDADFLGMLVYWAVPVLVLFYIAWVRDWF